MADLSYTVDVKGHDDLPKLAAGIDAVATALGNGKDIAKKLAEFKAAMGGMGGSLDGLKGLEGKLDSFKKTLSSKLDGLDQTVKNELKTIQSTVATSVGGISAEFEKIGKAAAAGLDKSGAAIKIAADRNLKLNAKYATDIETAIRQIQEKGTSSMLQSLQNRASNAQRILQSEAKDAVAIAQKAYGTDFVAAMQTGLQGKLSVLTNSHQATIRLLRTQHEQMIAEGRKAAAELANIQAQAQVKAATLNPMGNYSSMRSGREFQIKNAQLFMNMPSKADFEAATAIAVKDARDAQAKAMMQVRAATNNPVGAFQRYNSSTQTAGALIGANSTNALTGSVSAAIPKAQDIGQVKQLSTAFQKLAIDGNDVHSAMRGLASGFNLLWLTWGNLLPLFAGAAISNGFMKTAKEGLKVTQTLGTIAYLGENTAQEMRVLTDELVSMGKNGIYGPIAIAEAMQTLSLAGLKANEILAVTGTVMGFSVAGATDIKTAADVLVSVTTAFGTGAAGFSRSADIIMRAAADSKASVESFGEAMKTASVVGEQYGAKQEDVALLIQYLANLGIQGSAAGTAVRNMYADISGRSGPARKAMKELGLDFRDAEGHVIGLKEQTDQLVGVLSKYDGKSQANILQAIYGERGAKAAIELLVKAKTYILENGKLTTQLEIDQRKLENSYGDAAIAAVKMGTTTQNAFKAAGATLETTLFGAFTAMEPQLYAVAVALREAFGSKDLQDTLAKLVSGVADIAKYVAENIQTIVSAGLAYGAYKLAVVAVTVAYGAYQNILVALETVKAINLARTTAQVAAELELGAALGIRTTAEINAAKAAAADAAANVGKLTVMGSLAKAIPFVGTAITLAGLAWMGYDMWASRSGSTMDDLSGQKSKDMITALRKENDHLEAVNEARERGLSLLEAEALVKANNAKSDVAVGGIQKMSGIQSEIDSLQGQKNNAINLYGANAPGYVKDQIKTWDLQLARKRVEMRQAGEESRKVQADLAQEEQRRSDNAIHVAVLNTAAREKEAAATKKLMDEYRRLYGTGSKTWEQSQGGANSRTQKPGSYDEQTLPNLQKQMDSDLSVIKARFDSEKAIQDSEYKNLLVTQGQYQAKVLASTVTFEQDSIAVIEKSSADYVNAYVEQYAEIKKVRDGFKPDSENWKAEDAKLEALRNKATTDMQADEDKHVKIKLDSNKRQILAAQDLAGETRKLIKADEEYWTKSKLETGKIKSMQKVAEQYRNINTSVFSNATALKAEAEAIAESKAQHEGQLENIRKEIELRVDAITALEELLKLERAKANITGNSAVSDELEKTIGANKAQLEGLRDRYSKSVAEGTADGAERGALAYQKEMEAKAAAVTDSIAGAIETAIFKSGKEGGKALRDYLQAELVRKPLMAVVKAIIQPISSMVVGGLAGGAANAAAGQAGGSALGSAGGSLMGSALGGIGAFGTGASYGAASLFANGLTGTLAAGGQMIGAGSIMGGLGTIAGALGPIAIGIAALSSLIKKSTPHTGGIGAYSAASGATTGASVGLAFGIDQKHYTQAGEDLSTNVAKSIVGIFDTTATTFGKQAGYYAATAFADDSSKDGAWGALRIKFGEKVLLDWADTAVRDANVPREFADGEAGSKEYLAAVAASARDALVQAIGDVDWATDMLTALGESPTLESLAQTVQQINAAQAAFDALGKNIVGFGALTDGAISQLVKAAGSIDGLVSAASAYYDNFYSEAEKTANVTRDVAAALADVGLQMPTTREEFRALVESQMALGDAGTDAVAALLGVSGAFASVTAASETAADAAARLADEQGKAAEDAARAAAEEAARRAEEIARERYGLETQIMQLLGDTAGLRMREIEALDASNRALQEHIYAIEDAREAYQKSITAANDAYSGLERSVAAEKTALQAQYELKKKGFSDTLKVQADANSAQVEAARAAADKIKGIASALQNALKSSRVDSPSINAARLSSARSTISGAAESNNLFTPGLESALAVAGADNKQFYGRFEDYAYAQGVTAGEIAKLNTSAQAQLSAAESIVSSLAAQNSVAQLISDAEMAALDEWYAQELKKLDDTLTLGKSQLDAMLGIDNSVLSVADAVANLANAINASNAALQVQKAAEAAAQMAAMQGGGGGGGAGGPEVWRGQTYTDFMGNQVALQAGQSKQFHEAVAAAGTAAVGSLSELRDRLQAVGKSDIWDALSKDLTLSYQDVDKTGGRGVPSISASDGVILVAGYRSDNESMQDYATKISGWAQNNGVQGSTNNGYSQSDISNAISTTLGQGANVADILNAGAANFGLTEQEIRDAAHAAGIPGFATGINRVPHDMLARIHKDEAVVPAAYNPYNPGASAPGNSEVVAELRKLNERLDAIEANTRATAGHAAGTDRKLARVIQNDAIKTETTV